VNRSVFQTTGLSSEPAAELLNHDGHPEDPAASHPKFGFPPGVFLMTDSFQTGGSERQFVELARALDQTAYRLTLGCLQTKGTLGSDLGPVEHFDLGGSLYRFQSMRARYRLARFLQRSKIAIAHAFDYYTNLTLIPAAKLARTPVVIGSQRQLGDLLTPHQRRAQLAMLRWADCVICNSQAAAQTLVADGMPSEKLRVIGNGLPSSAFAETAPALPRSSGRFRVGMVARMNSLSKNHRHLMKAASHLRNYGNDFEIILVGDGPLRPDLERYAQELGISDLVRFLGDRRDISAILASLDATVLPSASESLSNSILESMAAGVPVIATDVGGNRELINDDRGVLVPANDQEALAQALRSLGANVEPRVTMGRNAKAFVQKNFTIELMRRKHEALYAELLERKGWSFKSSASVGREAASKSPTRVTIVAPSLRYVGGQSVQADLLLRHWQNDPEVQAQLVMIDPPFPRGLKWIEKIPGLRTLVREPLYARELWRGLAESDIAHIFSASYWSFLLAPAPAWILARLRKTKVLLHYHSGEARDHLRRFPMARSTLRRVDVLVVPSRYLVDVFNEFGLKAQVVPNIADLSQFQFRERLPLRPHLLCTRGFHPYYRVDLVVRAFAEVQKIFPQARLDLAGQGPTESEIRRLVREMNLSGVTFLGVISRDQIGRAYDQADIFVNASSLDNMPVSVLEAFAAGTPVVSTAPEGMNYLVEHERTGLLSPTGDAGQLGENIARLLRDAELSSRLCANAYQESQRYRWEAVREQWLQVYREAKSQ
jgi:glycosyltransferase involved in cell wall biosynthesis